MVSDTKSTATGSGYADALRALADADAATRKPRFMFEADDGEGGESRGRWVGGARERVNFSQASAARDLKVVGTSTVRARMMICPLALALAHIRAACCNHDAVQRAKMTPVRLAPAGNYIQVKLNRTEHKHKSKSLVCKERTHA
jgi:hypothetical protein